MTPLLLGVVAALVVVDLLRRARPPAIRWRAPRLGSRQRDLSVMAALVLLGLVAAPLAAVVPLLWWTTRRVKAHRAERSNQRQVAAALPDLVDLLALACSAGWSLPMAHPLVARHAPAPVGPALMAAHEAASAGLPRADTLLAALAPMGDRARALADLLVDHLRYGVPLLPGLERAGLELRVDRRRRAELEARRVPVRLLAPLVACILPAFALLTVVPLLAASLDALPR